MIVHNLPIETMLGGRRLEPADPCEFEIPGGSEDRLVAKNDPDSIGSELLRTLASRLNHAQTIHPLKKLLITSAVQGEGKTMLAANLSITLAMLSKRVLLIDGDLRSSSLSRWFGIVERSSLTAACDESTYPTPPLRKAKGLSLWVRPAGKPTAGSNSLAQATAIADTLAAYQPEFDWILVDSPPVVPFGDAGALANASDAVLLVTRRGLTPKNMLDEALQTLDPKKILATVFNGANVRCLKYYDDYYGRAERNLPGRREHPNRISWISQSK